MFYAKRLRAYWLEVGPGITETVCHLLHQKCPSSSMASPNSPTVPSTLQLGTRGWAMDVDSSFLLLVVRPGATFVASERS